MQLTVKQRLVQYLKYKKIGQNRFESLAGLSNGYISNLKTSPSVDKAEKIFVAAPDLNRDWLLRGEGEMLNVMNELESIPTPAVESGLPVYEDAYFGCSPGGFMGALKDADARMAVPGLADDGRTFVVRARGESMVNRDNPSRSIPDGAYVAIQKTALSTPLWGEAYALATDDGCIIKRLYPSEREGCVRCVSINADEFPAFELRTDEIHDFGLVKAVITVAIWR